MLHNRLTHSLKVEQAGMSIFRYLNAQEILPEGECDEWAIAAACLAHDLGHPPFGHAGEVKLNELVTCSEHQRHPKSPEERKSRCQLCKLEDGFEGNAQTFRILTALSETGRHRKGAPRGLDLTAESLRAASKYPWLRGANPKKPDKWGAYDIDAPALEAISSNSLTPAFSAQVMDWADDIAYAVHDIEDFHQTGHIPLNQYVPEINAEGEPVPGEAFNNFEKYLEAAGRSLEGETRRQLISAMMYFPKYGYSGSQRDLTDLALMRGMLIEQFISSCSVEGLNLVRDPKSEGVNSALKQLIWFHVIDNPSLSNVQTGQQRVLQEIFDELSTPTVQAAEDWAEDEPDTLVMRRLPRVLRKYLEIALTQEGNYDKKQRAYRALLDYISAMSETEAYHTHAVLKGHEAGARLN